MKALFLWFSMLALFGANQAYVVQRRIPLDDGIFNDILNLTMSVQDTFAYKATVNNFAEKILANLDRTLKQEKLDPLPMDDIYKGYWWGNFQLWKMEASGLATLYRPDEDAILSYTHENKQLQFDLPISFRNLKFSTKFKASFMFMGPSGEITGEVSNVLMRTSLVIDFNVNQAFLRMFEIPDSGHISIHIHSSIFSDWMYNLMSDAITAIFKSYILEGVAGVVQDLLGELVDVLNHILQQVFG